jgi:hypothetical protein
MRDVLHIQRAELLDLVEDACWKAAKELRGLHGSAEPSDVYKRAQIFGVLYLEDLIDLFKAVMDRRDYERFHVQVHSIVQQVAEEVNNDETGGVDLPELSLEVV